MGIGKHSIGGYRAYKKINGKEYQFYSFDIIECQEKQKIFDALSLKIKAKTPQKIFNKNGRFNGFTIRAVIRKNRTSCILAIKQITGKDGIIKKELRINNVNDAIAWIEAAWIEFYGFTTKKIISLRKEIKLARALYIADIAKEKLKISTNL